MITLAEIEGAPYYNDKAGEYILTTWHEDELVDEILWNATSIGCGCDEFESDNPQIIIALLANDRRIPEIHRIARSFPDSLHSVVDRD